ncbi:hypothetical protein E7744_03380 [Citricoccus sp. SGAir0253]|uniref:hypothetical protein n=1 Tax=Citricoccus sp. SGAir0253 TaxID=2567881 RepID=UPI0010CCD661|nr:hypothetical protein [Citricoccus sp. SGAir0253]QCU77362.1 hypothetical protein E7744_03380 [Citricoccus sp. SGAir0253]
MTDQNHPDQPSAEQPGEPTGQPGQQPGHPGEQPGRPGRPGAGRPLEDAEGQPRYGVRLTPEQMAEHQAQQQAQPQAPQQSQQPGAYPPPAYGRAPQAGGPAVPGQPASSPYGQAPYAQQPYGQAPYGQAPYAQQPYGQPGAGYPAAGPASMGPVVRPKEVDRSYWLILAAGVAFLVIELLNVLSPSMGLTPDMRQQLQAQLDDAGVAVDLPSLLESVRVTAVVFTVVVAGLYVLVATGIRRGSNVARIFGTIFAALSLPAVLGLGFVYVALGVAGIVFAYLPRANEYFRGRAWEKALRR